MDGDALSVAEIEAFGREAVSAGWGLLGEWWCVPVDATSDEQAALVARIKTSMDADFEKCPDEWIADRLYGGFVCTDPNRRHVYFASGQYSFLAAAEGHYVGNNAGRRVDQWTSLIEKNSAQAPPLDGPFTDDAPRAAPQPEKEVVDGLQ